MERKAALARLCGDVLTSMANNAQWPMPLAPASNTASPSIAMLYGQRNEAWAREACAGCDAPRIVDIIATAEATMSESVTLCQAAYAHVGLWVETQLAQQTPTGRTALCVRRTLAQELEQQLQAIGRPPSTWRQLVLLGMRWRQLCRQFDIGVLAVDFLLLRIPRLVPMLLSTLCNTAAHLDVCCKWLFG
jgi:hypothetical protein